MGWILEIGCISIAKNPIISEWTRTRARTTSGVFYAVNISSESIKSTIKILPPIEIGITIQGWRRRRRITTGSIDPIVPIPN
jgi:hypothetical protein